ncbi:MAG: D-aminoacyl-tRNA deacylase [Candidatus Omnitrophota bacterium]
MRAVIQRVSRAEVRIDNASAGKIGKGLLIFLAVAHEDTEADLNWLLEKICQMRLFPNEAGKFDRSLLDIGGEVLLVSQFTLYGECRKGRRPDFTKAAPPEKANDLYEKGILWLRNRGIKTESGRFAAMMDVELVNDGPVTIILDSPTANSIS